MSNVDAKNELWQLIIQAVVRYGAVVSVQPGRRIRIGENETNFITLDAEPEGVIVAHWKAGLHKPFDAGISANYLLLLCRRAVQMYRNGQLQIVTSEEVHCEPSFSAYPHSEGWFIKDSKRWAGTNFYTWTWARVIESPIQVVNVFAEA